MGQKNRLVLKAKVGPHKDHTMVANKRISIYAGKKLISTILRCYTCFQLTGNDSVQVEQIELQRERF